MREIGLYRARGGQAMSIQIFILSKLTERHLYPYQLKKYLSEPVPLGQLMNLTESKLYYHFEALRKHGLIEPVELVKDDNRPEKQLFAITDIGRTQLSEKIYQLFDKAKNISEMLIGLLCIHHVDRGKVISILEYKLVMMEQKEGALATLHASIPVDSPKGAFGSFLANYHQQLRMHEIESLKALIKQLKLDVQVH